ncbi:sensor histidine kinase [Actinomadura montaniterrae]|uniref:histidine kinase n=1 Tax=Actinomadura montaniterrae TaxID=1803903 RepID=A0A6L3W324_9ACTN|nr:ATP-binding protein [Actinomadura montaniterrae]KAB2385957.1 ATP-binding protein [Actinomadura montaniterrae]
MPEFSPHDTAAERQGVRSPGIPLRRRRLGDARVVQLGLTVLPSVLMAALGLAAVMILIEAGASSHRARFALGLVGAAAVLILYGTVVSAATPAWRGRLTASAPLPETESAHLRLNELTSLVFSGREEVRELKRQIAIGEIPPHRPGASPPAPAADPVTHLAWELRESQKEAWNALVESAASSAREAPESGVDMFVKLSLRMQTLLHRALQRLDEMEGRVEDPELLKGLFKVDHLTARVRRQAESLAVIGGAAPRRQWSRPVSVYEVVRSAIAEVEHYDRVKVVLPVDGSLDGSAVADVVHLLAELVENATKFAPPGTEVLVRAETVTAGIAVEIEDRGLGIPADTRRRLNDLLTGGQRIDTGRLVKESRIGLLVVSALSCRHKIRVELRTNIYGGTQAVVVIPNELIGAETPGIGAHPAPPVGAYPSGPSGQRREQQATTAFPPDGHPSATPPMNVDGRPGLPRRRAQGRPVPEPPAAAAAPIGVADIQPNHALMAAFRKGLRDGDGATPGNDPKSAGA